MGWMGRGRGRGRGRVEERGGAHLEGVYVYYMCVGGRVCCSGWVGVICGHAPQLAGRW